MNKKVLVFYRLLCSVQMGFFHAGKEVVTQMASRIQCFGELCGIAADLNGGALDSGCHLRNHLLAGMKKAHLHGAE